MLTTTFARPTSILLRSAGAVIAALTTALADEGMWLYNEPPRALLQARYGFDATPEWLDHLQKSSIRFNSGGSASFVSGDGLILTNHHVGAGALQKLSDEGHDYVRDGFYARQPEQEKPCAGLELNVLMSVDDVTARVNAAVLPGMTAEEAFSARRAVSAAIESESLAATGLRSDVVGLWEGGAYHLYRYKRFTDVRLVFAPEQQAAFYGGDPDNFEYPRYDLDICLFRAWEKNAPAKMAQYLRWSAAGAGEKELVFVSGNPGHTNRELTVAALESIRDGRYPFELARLNAREVLLTSWSERGDEQARRAKGALFGTQNSRKAMQGALAALLNPAVMSRKKAMEQELQEAVARRPDLENAAGAWAKISQAEETLTAQRKAEALLEHGAAFDSHLFEIARTLLRKCEEKTKPSGQRLREYRDSNEASLDLQLFSEEPIYDDFEKVRLAGSLTFMAETLPDHALKEKILGGEPPAARAARLVEGSKLKDVAIRKTLASGSAADLAAFQDPMVELARMADPESRRLRLAAETAEETERQAYAAIAAARLAVARENNYPDATFTPRLAFGETLPYQEDGRKVPFQTTFAGLYERAAAHHNRFPFELPPRWLEQKARVDPSTPFNFVCTADIIGGNSGSPVVNRAGEFVGIIFDGNIQSLGGNFLYTEEQARAVSVHSRAITEALRKVYDAGALADELTSGKIR